MTLFLIENVTFWGKKVSAGFSLERKGISGWDEGVASRRTETDLPQAAGSFDLPSYQDSRTVSLSGLCHARSPEQLGWFKAQLIGLMNRSEQIRIVGEMDGLTSWALGRNATTAPSFDQVTSTIARYQVQFWCPNPRRFGELREFTTAENAWTPVYHYGNFVADPVFEVSGDFPAGYRIYGKNGLVFTVDSALSPGHVDLVDFGDGTVMRDGLLLTGSVGQWNVWSVDPGETVAWMLQPRDGGSGQVVARVRDTYI